MKEWCCSWPRQAGRWRQTFKRLQVFHWEATSVRGKGWTCPASADGFVKAQLQKRRVMKEDNTTNVEHSVLCRLNWKKLMEDLEDYKHRRLKGNEAWKNTGESCFLTILKWWSWKVKMDVESWSNRYKRNMYEILHGPVRVKCRGSRTTNSCRKGVSYLCTDQRSKKCSLPNKEWKSSRQRQH